MDHRFSVKWILIVVAILASAVLAGGCGGSSSASVSPSPAASTADIVARSWEKMKDVKSATFAADLSLRVEGDTKGAAGSAQTALLSQGVTLRAEGAGQVSQARAEVTLRLGLGEQKLNVDVRSLGDEAWLRHEGTWYAIDHEAYGKVSPGAGASPSAQLEGLGLDPQKWDAEYTLVGTETLGGAEVYHVRAAADPRKAVDALLEAAENPELAKQLGSGQAEQLEQALSQNEEQAEALKQSLEDMAVEYWIGVEDLLMRKVAFAGRLVPRGLEGMEGVDAVAVEGAVTLGSFDEPVSVAPPAKARPFDELITRMLGGMMAGGAASAGS